jgi:hypothetical protein
MGASFGEVQSIRISAQLGSCGRSTRRPGKLPATVLACSESPLRAWTGAEPRNIASLYDYQEFESGRGRRPGTLKALAAAREEPGEKDQRRGLNLHRPNGLRSFVGESVQILSSVQPIRTNRLRVVKRMYPIY